LSPHETIRLSPKKKHAHIRNGHERVRNTFLDVVSLYLNQISHVTVQWTNPCPSPQWWWSIHLWFANDYYMLLLKIWRQEGKQKTCTKTYMTRQWIGCTMNCCKGANSLVTCTVARKIDCQINHKQDYLTCLIPPKHGFDVGHNAPH